MKLDFRQVILVGSVRSIEILSILVAQDPPDMRQF